MVAERVERLQVAGIAGARQLVERQRIIGRVELEQGADEGAERTRAGCRRSGALNRCRTCSAALIGALDPAADRRLVGGEAGNRVERDAGEREVDIGVGVVAAAELQEYRVRIAAAQ